MKSWRRSFEPFERLAARPVVSRRARQPTLAIIPARAGSRGIPRKNLVPLGGAPLLAYTLHAAREARLVDRVVVSTDGGEIANLSRSFGIEVLERPQALAGSLSPMIDTVLHSFPMLATKSFAPPHA